jgi:hypothetical protein
MKRFTIRTRMLVMGVGGIALTVLVLMSVAVWQTGDLADLARAQSDELIGEQLDAAARGVTRSSAAELAGVAAELRTLVDGSTASEDPRSPALAGATPP